MTAGGDRWRWGLAAPDYRPTIAVIESVEPLERSEGTKRGDRHDRHAAVERVPFGFARALIERGLCGAPRPNRPHLGGCIERIGHGPDVPHKYRPDNPAPIRPVRHSKDR